MILRALLLILLAAPALAQPRGTVRTGTEGDRGRIVFDWTERVPHRVDRDGDRVRLRFGDGRMPDLAGARRLPRHVVAVAADAGAVVVTLSPGARSRVFTLGNRVVLDATAAPETPPRSASRPERGNPQLVPTPPPPVAAAPPPVAEQPQPVAATPAPPPAASAPVLLRADAETGLAVFRRGEDMVFVLDRADAPDLTPFAADPAFAALRAQGFPGGQMFRMPLAAPATLVARRVPQGWTFAVERDASPPQAILASVEDAPQPRLIFRAARPGRVVSVPDPETGAPLLVATMRTEGEGVALPRLLPDARILPTLLGVVVLPRSDHLALRTVAQGFALQGTAQRPLRLGTEPGTPPVIDAGPALRLLDLPQLDRAALSDRLRAHQAEIAAAPPLGRAEARRLAAATLLAMGLAQEAQSLAALALREDPRARQDARLLLLHGAAAVAAHRPAEAGTLDEAVVPDGDETRLWRALRQAALGEDTEAGPVIAAALPMLLSYPDGLRGRVLPRAIDALAEAGAWAGIRRLAEEGVRGPTLAFAQARKAEAEGRAEDALRQYEALAAGPDRNTRARAARRAVELRHAGGALDAAQAAAALDGLVFAWRGDAEELRLRQRIAALHRAAGAPRAAFTVLEETALLFPDRLPSLRPLMEDLLAEAIATEPPLAAAALHAAHRGLLTGAAAARAGEALAGRLLELDLPDQAGRLLREAMDAAPDIGSRAAIGARLALLRLGEGDARGAVEALDASAGEPIPDSLRTDRAVAMARALAMQGETDRAAAILDSLGPAGALPLAELRAGQQDWAAAALALARHAEALVPDGAEPLAPAQQQVIAQWAAFLAMAGDAEALAALRAQHGARLANGPFAEAFALLTADPLRGTDDLPRLAREMEMLRLLPSRLEALRSAAATTR